MNDKVVKLPSAGSASIVESMVDTDQSILHAIMAVDRARRNGSHHNSLPVVTVPVPSSVLIACPMTSPHQRQAHACPGCGHFGGIVQKAWSDTDPLPWATKYAVRCGFPLERGVSQMVVEP